MKEIDLTKLTADPLSKARSEAVGETSIVSGFVRNVGRETIALAQTQTSKSYTEFERSSIVAAFEDEKNRGKVTFLISRDTVVKIVTTRRLSTFGESKNCKCPDTGVAEARPLGSIHPALAELAREMARIKAEVSEGSNELTCAEKRADCFREGGTEDECDLNATMCNMGSFFDN